MSSVNSVASSSVTPSHNGTYNLVSCMGQTHASTILQTTKVLTVPKGSEDKQHVSQC